MATYTELYNIHNNNNLHNKIAIALTIKAASVLDAASSATTVAWTRQVFDNPNKFAEDIMNYVLAKAKDFTVSQINNVSDAQLQTYVNAAVDKLLTGI